MAEGGSGAKDGDGVWDRELKFDDPVSKKYRETVGNVGAATSWKELPPLSKEDEERLRKDMSVWKDKKRT